MKNRLVAGLLNHVASAVIVTALTVSGMPLTGLASGGTGGGGGGGGGTVVVAPAVTSLKVTSGYGPYGGRDGDLQATYSASMGSSGYPPSVRVSIVDVGTGLVWWNQTSATLSGTAGYKYLPLNKTFTVTVEVLGPTGTVLTSKSTTASTPSAPKIKTT